MRAKAHVREVGLRDGIQMVAAMLPAERKLEWCRRAAAAGVGEIEVTSFVPPKVVPQFADAAEVATGALTVPGITASALVPNLKGAERGIDLGIRKLNYVLSASEEHNLANVRRTTDESIADFGRIIALRDARAKGEVRVAGGIATVFGCTIAGSVSEKRVVAIAERLAELGADELVVADTVGYASPFQVKRIVRAIQGAVGDLPIALHFHDTRGLGMANVAAGVEAGVTRFDASLGGLGGCPFAPGATGNIDTEDCVYLLEELGFDTGIDIEALVALRRTVEYWLPDERFSGAIARAGLPKTFRQPALEAA
ncbi:hydroxymethylglutaryl-CoA lyase [Marinivivus vitaminiproducens]|uniref:hydroxymethylglutaryl-CoA lyase n=1 Tax=Marinivivus vitaminiproducens TaxID=3035935 RepID=UPI00279E9F9E|nr:hydroxymethylglutaryl-CoA lyase [Geminicoccaceae bacterium SCSIO 64248]